MLDAARTVRSIGLARTSARSKVGAQKIARSRALYGPTDPISTLDSATKVALLGKVETLARAKDPRVVQVMAGLAMEYDVVMVARADGVLAAESPLHHSAVRLAQEDPKTFVPLLIKTMPPEPRVPQENGLNIHIDLT